MIRELQRIFVDTGERIENYTKLFVRDGSIELKLVDCGSSGVLLHRIHTRLDGSITVQMIDATDAVRLTEFLENDPYNEVLAPRYRTIVQAVETRANASHGVRPFVSIADCCTELDVLALMRSVCIEHGGDYAIFHWLSSADTCGLHGAIYDTHVMLAACPPSWLLAYERRVETDPVLVYARNNVMPTCGFESFGSSNGAWFAREAVLYGLRSNVFLPATRSSERGKLHGLLHVSSSKSAPYGETEIWRHQRELRGLAEELLDWPTIRYKRAAAAQFQLSDAEKIILQWIRRGGDATHAAADLALTQRQIYRHYKSIKVKMGRDDIRACARMAAEAGLVD
ncbi:MULTISPECIES: hypothetical protein [Burkholderia]|uniref:Uncharacterized protein n=1 Tax=Burkholderia humptydooensis TaxID=430531 RepID=A0A7U4P8H0_9BURK|nr:MULTISPECIES: hypothetical protein [Burkholderia]AGK50016.1 autoinducer binding domain protein [Burkholderia thailandensis MSMB121]ATF33892.1 hypothetical protein CO709_11785 [Burkholderia thailandensis]AJY40677.1 autoinducer binding domain protein [Burkholderia sp. 2002721687]ALX44887.1 hypothetical protein AQ610_20315 [Burkholderia humptydooensis]KST71975.1 hypothetical protein WS76_26000 [Burkholderia humptydooensis]